MRNCDVEWEKFDQHAYVERNYGDPLQADLIIISKLARFYKTTPTGGEHIEIGVGPNLYPLMVAAKYCDLIHVTDIAASSLDYINSELAAGLTETWSRWHTILREHHCGYETDAEMAQRLRDICIFERSSVLDLPESSYDSSSMMFVAESITDDPDVYCNALLTSLRCVRPGGTFSVALMLNSQGYTDGGGTFFPAVSVTTQVVKSLIDPEVSDVEYSEIDFNVRHGHEGMLLATGRR